MAHLLRSGIRPPHHRQQFPTCSHSPHHTRAPAFNFKKAHWDEFEKYISEHPLPPIEEAQNIHCAAQSFSSLLLNEAKASILFGRLGHPPKTWWSEEEKSAVQDRRRARSEAHSSEAHRLAYVEASRRACSVISRAITETWQATCNNLSPRSNPVLFSTSFTQVLVRKVLLATQNCHFQTLNFHCLRPRPHSLYSTDTSPPFSPTTSSLHLQLVLVFTYLFLKLETCHHYPHTQTR